MLDVLIVPRASREKIGPVTGGRLKIAVTAPPVEGDANAAVVALLAWALGVPRRNVSVVRGEASRRKTVRIAGVTPAQVAALCA